MQTFPDANSVVRKLIDLYGGRDAASQAFDQRFRAVSERWSLDAGVIGRILRAHLFVEHYLTQYLRSRNPNLGDVDEARLSFTQKLALLGDCDNSTKYLVPGIQRLNKVRNRLAHTLRADVTAEDSQTLLAIGLFREIRKALVSDKVLSEDPVTVLEDFAKHAGLMLEAASNPDRWRWAEAMKDCKDTEAT